MAVQPPNSSFDRLFARNMAPREEPEDAEKPSVHALFTAAMREELGLTEFEEALEAIHDIRLTPAAVRLLTSVDAASGRLSFAHFQRALQDSAGSDYVGAGKPIVIKDQAAAIIKDNCGEPVPGATFAAPKVSTDISADRFVKQSKRLGAQQSRGAFSDNPVIPSNKASVGNPLAPQRGSSRGPPSNQDEREVGQTATRMFVSGEINRREYEGFLRENGLKLSPESELQRLIVSHEKVGDGDFLRFSRAMQKELAKEGADAASAVSMATASAANSVSAAGVRGHA